VALSPKERERIIEEEQLRFETRQTLSREHCAKHRPNRWLWWVALVVVAYFAFCHSNRCPMGYGGGWMHGEGKSCHHGDWADGADKAEPSQPLAPKK
jgi:hypothetical protein